MHSRTVVLVAFQVVWLISASAAAHGCWGLGVVASGILVAIFITAASSRRFAVLVIAASGLMGLVIETVLVRGGWVNYAASWPMDGLPPIWIVCLWLAFGTTIEISIAFLAKMQTWKVAALSATLGPLSYIAGERVGALSFPEPAWRGQLAVALLLGIAMPGLLAIVERARK